MTEKKVYILLTDTGSLLTKLIKLYTKKQYNHASVALDFELSEVYSFGRKKLRNPFIGGFVRENVKQGLFREATCAVYALSVTEGQLQKMEQFIREMDEQKEYYRYNFIGLFGFIFNKPIKREKAFFCSQFVASVLKECGIMKFEKPLSLVAPSDLQERAELKLVYEGKLKEYQHKGTDGEWYDGTYSISVGF